MKSTQQLVEIYRNNPMLKAHNPEIIHFEGVGDRDVYNISAPFSWNGEIFLLGRVEKRDSEISQAMFFVQNADGIWEPKAEAPIFNLQDPFFTFIDGQLVLGGVEVSPNAVDPKRLDWRTIFYMGDRLATLEEWFRGPVGMKDLRLKQLDDGRLFVLTRPQGEKGGRGKIGYVIVADKEELTLEVIENAPLIENQFLDEEWGGGNEIYNLNESHIGILGHIANFDENGDRHYYPMVFTLNVETGDASEIRVIAERKDFLAGPSKRPDLQDVVFSGGLINNEDGVRLYAGISDAQAQLIMIPDPFAPK